jgi:hypothetical protein
MDGWMDGWMNDRPAQARNALSIAAVKRCHSSFGQLWAFSAWRSFGTIC